MKILALETATEACSVALWNNGALTEQFQLAPRQHASLILPMMEQLLADAQYSLTALDAIAFGCGPGSFMGVRIATSVAQALGYAADLPVVPISTLQALAQTVCQGHSAQKVLAAWDARMGEVYWGAYCQDTYGVVQALQADVLSAPQLVAVPTGSNWVRVGNAWQVYATMRSALPEIDQQKIVSEMYPHASAIAYLADSYYQTGQFASALDIQPVYLRNQVTHS